MKVAEEVEENLSVAAIVIAIHAAAATVQDIINA